jgi:TatD DNase family protein
MVALIDTHAHLDDGRFSDDLDEVVARAARAGVEQVIAVGITLESSRSCLRLAGRYPAVFATVGLHPNEVGAVGSGDWDEVVRLAGEARVVGLGESGLDRYRDRSPFAAQEDYFARHLELGFRLNKAVVIHAREADADILRLLRERFDRHGPIRAVLHSFTGSAETAAAAVAMGLHVSIAGMVTYPKAQDVRDMAATIPLERLLVETDCPYLSPQPVRGKRNEPAFVAHTAAGLAEVFGLSVETIAEHTTRNARALFGLPTP